MIKTLAKSIRQYKKLSLLSPMFVIGEVIIEMLIPYLVGILIDKGIIEKIYNTNMYEGSMANTYNLRLRKYL